MEAEKIFKNKAECNYKIKIELWVDGSSDGYKWNVYLWKQEKGKRKWEEVNCYKDPEYIELLKKGGDREKYYLSFLLVHVPAFWIREVQGMIIRKLSKAVI